VATVAPRGRDAWFDRLLEVKERLYRGRFQLQFSVQSTEECERERLIPMPHWPIEKLAEYGQKFFRPGDRKVVLNFALARDVTYRAETIEALFSPDCFAVKLTPVNPTASGRANGFETVLRSERDVILQKACDRLTSAGYDVVLSVGDEREDQIGSNCGQAVRVEREVRSEAYRESRPALTI
jgi:23S rRNA (adenine2503-C2)-methyltransferase